MSSLVGMAIRIAAIRAVRGRTYAGDRVHDSAISPVDHMVEEGNDEPFIVISTEDEEAKEIGGRDVGNGMRTVDLVIEVAIAHAVTAAPTAEGDDPPPPDIVIPATDGGFELSLGLMSRQISEALFSERSADPWSTIFARLAPKVVMVSARRGVGNKDGARFAARQIIFRLDVMQEPPFGHELGAVGELWRDVIDAMESDSDLEAVVPLIRSAVTGDPGVEAWDRGRADQGLTPEAADNIGIGMEGGLDESPPLLSRGDLDNEGRVND